MDSTDLAFFSAVAGSGGMSRAAARLNTVQSNVTAHIRALEEELGAPLFHRSRKGVTLTPVGARLLPYARRVAELLDEARRAVAEEGAPAGELRIGCLETTAALRLPPVLGAYGRSFPHVDLQIETGPTAALVERVLERALDGAFVSGPVSHSALASVPVIAEELVMVTPPAVDGAAPLAVYLAASSGAKAIMFRSGCSYRQRLEEVLAHHGCVDIRRMEMGTLDGIIGCVAAGLGFTLLPRAVVAAAAAEGVVALHPLEPGAGRAETLFIRRADGFLSRALDGFIAHALACGAGAGPCGLGRMHEAGGAAA